MNILYVEDNPQNMRLVRKILKHAGFTVLEAETGLQGLDLARSELPDLILMDIRLPDIDGLECAARLKSDEVTQRIPIIALTANAMVGDREKALEAGCDGYLLKPISKSDLLDRVNGYMNEGILPRVE